MLIDLPTHYLTDDQLDYINQAPNSPCVIDVESIKLNLAQICEHLGELSDDVKDKKSDAAVEISMSPTDNAAVEISTSPIPIDNAAGVFSMCNNTEVPKIDPPQDLHASQLPPTSVILANNQITLTSEFVIGNQNLSLNSDKINNSNEALPKNTWKKLNFCGRIFQCFGR